MTVVPGIGVVSPAHNPECNTPGADCEADAVGIGSDRLARVNPPTIPRPIPRNPLPAPTSKTDQAVPLRDPAIQ
jgi:hypothetical protein